MIEPPREMPMRIALLMLPWVVAPALAGPTLEQRIKPIADAHKGEIAVAIRHLETGESYVLNGDAVMQTASLIKLAIMATAYAEADAGRVDLRKMLTLSADDKVQGAGILTDHFSVGTQLSVRDAIRLMIRYSDNTATNMVIDQVGLKTVTDWTKANGMPETRLNGKVFKGAKTTLDPERLKKYQLGSTSPNETIKLLELIHTHKAAKAESCQAMVEHLKQNDDKDMLLRFLPENFVAAHKTGATNRVRTDAGIFFFPDRADAKKSHPVAVCVLTGENGDTRWIKEHTAEIIIGQIGKAVYDHFQGR
jgi:beta-lactamase class A